MCVPAVEVSMGAPFGVLATQLARPDPPGSSLHEKLAATDVAYAKTEQAQVDQYQAIANSI